jgi:transglutaminase-like putative cysteine protease
MAVDRNPPPVFARSIAGLLTRFDDVKAGQSAFPPGDHDEVVLVSETVHFRDADGTRYWVRHQIYLATAASAVERLGSLVYSFDRERESIFLVDAATILPDGQRRPVTDKGAFIQTPQHEAENSLYTSQAELNLVFPNVAPGAATEATVLVRENVPVMPGEFCSDFTFIASRPTFLRRLVVDLPADDWPRVHALNSGGTVADPLTEPYAAGRVRKTWEKRLMPMSLWEESSPSYEFRAPTLWLTTLNSWDDIARWYHGLAAERSALGPELTAEVDRLTAGLTEPRQIVDRLCTTVANDVRYTGLEFGLAGYQPAPCREVWERRYGDCKDKANLLRAMLAHKGIAAHLALLTSGGLGYVERGSPSWHQFNHSIVAVEDGPGRYRFCDPTVKYLPAGVLGAGDRARDILVDHDGHAVWVRSEDDLNTTLRISADLKLGPDGDLSGWYTLAATGSTAAFYADYYNNMDNNDRRRSVQGYVEEFFPGASVVDIDYQPPTGAVAQMQLRAYLRRPSRANGSETINFPYPDGWLPAVDTVGDRKFPYGGMSRRDESVSVRIALPPGWSARSLPASFAARSDAADFAAGWTSKDGTLEAQLNWAPRKAEIPAADYGALQRSVRALRAWLAQPVSVAPAGETVAADSGASAPRPALDRFPILPTGEGQLRLLDEEFPAGKDDSRRRTALQQVLQWFPQDAETVFTAEVDLALLDQDHLGQRGFADQVAKVLQTHGTKVSLTARAWAEYLEAVARWHADKSRAALDRLRRMAADPAMPLFRRGWAAYEAARCLAESKPAAAAEYLQAFCSLESDAQEDSERQVAVYWTQAASGKGLAKFLGQVVDRHRTDPAPIVGKLLSAVADQWTGLTPAARTIALDAFAGVLVPPEKFPSASTTLATLRRNAAADAARRQFAEVLAGWLRSHPTKLWAGHPLKEYAAIDETTKVIDAANKAGEGAKVVEATLQLVLYDNPSYAAFAKYTDWAIWWLGKGQLGDDLFEELGTLALQLPAEASEDVIECWSDFASALARRGDRKRSDQILEQIFASAAAKDFQKVAAGGELGQNALHAGQVDEALACFRRIEPIHTTNKFGVDYLYVALLLELERGNLDRGLELVARIREQQPKFIKDAANSPALQPLLRAAVQPEALKRFWQRRDRWRPAWDALLAGAGVPPTPLNEPPAKIDWNAREQRVNKAAADGDLKAYLRAVGDAARVAQWVPAAILNFQENIDNSDNLPADVQNRLRECALAMVAEWQPVDAQVDNDIAKWEAEMLLGLGRKPAAAAKARALYERIGAESDTGETVLRVWAIAARGTAEEPATVAALTRLCAENRPLHNRLRSVRVLSDTLYLKADAVPALVLLERETARPDFDRNSDDGKILVVRLGELHQQHAAADALTTVVTEWKNRYCRDWFDQVGPASLDDPRCAGLKEPMLAATAGFASAERVKFNLLFALDDRQEISARESAFADSMVQVADATHDLGRFTAMLLEGADQAKLGLEGRKRLLAWAAFVAAEYRRPDLLARAAQTELYAVCPPAFRDSLAAIATELKTVEGGEPAQIAAAFRQIVQRPLDYVSARLADQLLCGLAVDGRSADADGLLAAATTLQVAPTLDQTPAGVRLQWSRDLHTAEQFAPLVRKLRERLAAIPPAAAADSARLRDRLRTDSILDLSAAESAAWAAWRLRTAADAREVDSILDGLWPAVAEQVLPADFGPDVFSTVLDLPLDDSLKAQYLQSAFPLCDVDNPAARDQVESRAKAFLAAPEAAKFPATVRALATARAWVALRNSRDERPDALFGPVATAKLPAPELRLLQLRFHHSRGNWAECDSLLASLDPDTMKSARVLAIAEASLRRNQRAGEIPMIVDAARESARSDVADLWFDPLDRRAVGRLSAYVGVDGAERLISEPLYDRLLARCRDAYFAAELKGRRARLSDHWEEVLRSSDEVLKLSPTTYGMALTRAEAHRALGHNAAARQDLELFLAHALDDVRYQEALQMLKPLGGDPAQPLRP